MIIITNNDNNDNNYNIDNDDNNMCSSQAYIYISTSTYI